MNRTEQKRLLGIVGFILALGALFVLFDRFVRSGPDDPDQRTARHEQASDEKPLRQQAGPMSSEKEAPWVRTFQKGDRTIWAYVRRRAYPGAPPIIPHRVEQKERAAEQNCQSCHEEGGYSEKFEAFTPVTPHRRGEFANCQQCHMPQRTEESFRESDWKTVSPPPTNQRDLPTAPPQIPHDLQNRSFCASCHAGPGAVQSLRSRHAHLSNCRQCHQPKKTDDTWERDQ